MTATRAPGRGPVVNGAGLSGRRHDPRIDPPTKADRRRSLAWVALLSICPICVGVVLWAAVGLNGNYPTVKPPVPKGWQAVPGIYASFSAPRDWSLRQDLSDAAGDVYYAGRGGGVGESVVEAKSAPSPHGPLPAIVAAFLGGPGRPASVASIHLGSATQAFEYRFALPRHQVALALMAWVQPTQSLVWLVVQPASPTTEKVLSTLTLAP